MKIERCSHILGLGFVVFFAHTTQAQSQSAPAPAAAPESVGAETENIKPQIPSTLMFSIDELNDIQGRIASVSTSEDDGAPSDQIENATLYLSTILYYAAKDWTIWINGKPIGPNDEFKEFQVTDIGPRHVELLVPLSAQGMRPVRLEPNQTFITKSGAVVEGAWSQ
jgi:hypothetical protein